MFITVDDPIAENIEVYDFDTMEILQYCLWIDTDTGYYGFRNVIYDKDGKFNSMEKDNDGDFKMYLGKRKLLLAYKGY